MFASKQALHQRRLGTDSLRQRGCIAQTPPTRMKSSSPRGHCTNIYVVIATIQPCKLCRPSQCEPAHKGLASGCCTPGANTTKCRYTSRRVPRPRQPTSIQAFHVDAAQSTKLNQGITLKFNFQYKLLKLNRLITDDAQTYIRGTHLKTVDTKKPLFTNR